MTVSVGHGSGASNETLIAAIQELQVGGISTGISATYILVGGAFTNPAAGKKRFIRFQWNGSVWVEQSRASADY